MDGFGAPRERLLFALTLSLRSFFCADQFRYRKSGKSSCISFSAPASSSFTDGFS